MNDKINKIIVNKTPHSVSLVTNDGELIKEFPKSDNPIRLEEQTERVGNLFVHNTEGTTLFCEKWSFRNRCGAEGMTPAGDERDWTIIPITKTSYKINSEIPKYEDGTFYIVSKMIQNAFPYRPDFIIPNQTVRDNNGRIIGCKSFSFNNGVND